MKNQKSAPTSGTRLAPHRAPDGPNLAPHRVPDGGKALAPHRVLLLSKILSTIFLRGETGPAAPTEGLGIVSAKREMDTSAPGRALSPCRAPTVVRAREEHLGRRPARPGRDPARCIHFLLPRICLADLHANWRDRRMQVRL
jgi:hypothetical protein